MACRKRDERAGLSVQSGQLQRQERAVKERESLAVTLVSPRVRHQESIE
jgi:hypothetical protein